MCVGHGQKSPRCESCDCLTNPSSLHVWTLSSFMSPDFLLCFWDSSVQNVRCICSDICVPTDLEGNVSRSDFCPSVHIRLAMHQRRFIESDRRKRDSAECVKRTPASLESLNPAWCLGLVGAGLSLTLGGKRRLLPPPPPAAVAPLGATPQQIHTGSLWSAVAYACNLLPCFCWEDDSHGKLANKWSEASKQLQKTSGVGVNEPSHPYGADFRRNLSFLWELAAGTTFLIPWGFFLFSSSQASPNSGTVETIPLEYKSFVWHVMGLNDPLRSLLVGGNDWAFHLMWR